MALDVASGDEADEAAFEDGLAAAGAGHSEHGKVSRLGFLHLVHSSGLARTISRMSRLAATWDQEELTGEWRVARHRIGGRKPRGSG